MDRPFDTFEDFWPYYVQEHRQPLTRGVHFAGTTAAMVCVAAGLLTRKPGWFGAALLVGYGAAWASHVGIEKNKPATFKHPLWSLKADLVMWRKMVDGTMTDEAERLVEAPASFARPQVVLN